MSGGIAQNKSVLKKSASHLTADWGGIISCPPLKGEGERSELGDDLLSYGSLTYRFLRNRWCILDLQKLILGLKFLNSSRQSFFSCFGKLPLWFYVNAFINELYKSRPLFLPFVLISKNKRATLCPDLKVQKDE